MDALNRLTFRVSARAEPGGAGPLVVTPEIDDVSLIELVGGFEKRHGFQPSGAYGGLIPSYFNYGDLLGHFLGNQARQWPRPGHAWLLGCDCGEVGCWPLTARIIALADIVSWEDFSQDHRPDWDYSGFGPFRFRREQYERAIRWVVDANGEHHGADLER